MKAILALEDGKIFIGKPFGAEGTSYGEVVFNTSMSGYQEIITDPSYKGQIIAMTYPLIGNYGVNSQDIESKRPFIEGFVVREYSKVSSNWRKEKTLSEYFKENKIIGIEGIDTRELTLHIRRQGAMKAVLSTEDFDKGSLVKKARGSRGLIGVDLVKEVTCKRRFAWDNIEKTKFKVVVLDCGAKYNILRKLSENNCQVIVVPAHADAREILNLKPDGLLLSNGPGDPAALTYVVATTRKLIGKVPIFGICLGHQMLGLALGGRTYKLKFGHHGANHPVKELKTGRVSITVQNHGFCVDISSLNKDLEITHVNLNDNTLEGMRHKKFPLFSVQFHPEASPGPHDADYLFANFITLMKKNKNN